MSQPEPLAAQVCLKGASWEVLQTVDADICQFLENNFEETEGS